MKNRVQLIEYVGQEPEIKTLEVGKKLANLSIATKLSLLQRKRRKN